MNPFTIAVLVLVLVLGLAAYNRQKDRA